MDIFFTKEWAELFADKYGGKVENFRFGDGDKFISYVFIKRHIRDLPFARGFEYDCFDIITPYGYGGVYLSPEARNDSAFIAEYKKRFNDYCAQHSIIAEFIRFHPLDSNHIFFADSHDLLQANDNVYINLQQSNNDILKNIDKRQRYSIRQAERSGVEIEIDERYAYFDDFKELHCQTMARNKADDFYYFTEDFFDKLIDIFKDRVMFLTAKLKDKIIAAALFIINDDNAYYFSGCSDVNFLKYSANHLILWRAINIAKEKNKKYFNLGGGLKRGDSLFFFKSGFSKSLAPYFIGKKIYNKDIYDKLVDLSGIKGDIDFFPKYRHSIKE